ncbi:hypothetical protein JCM15765_18670 [Paradesulfitobacterium aromaticivorans]
MRENRKSGSVRGAGREARIYSTFPEFVESASKRETFPGSFCVLHEGRDFRDSVGLGFDSQIAFRNMEKIEMRIRGVLNVYRFPSG